MSKVSERSLIQLISAVFLNAWAAGFLKGKIFTGKTKILCVPVLNCYSCPGALGACPIGSLQSLASGGERKISFYVLGTISLFGLILGRLVCGFVCPFGFIQDLLYKVPVKKLRLEEKTDRRLRYIKYGVLLLFVLVLPALVRDNFGTGLTWFCSFICPAGTLEAGIPLLAAVPGLRMAVGFLFSWKMLILLAVLFFSTKISRPFCKYICPLGAFYGLFSRFSLYQLKLDREKCVGCRKCEEACPMGVKCTKEINTAECIRCGECRKVCPTKAIDAIFGFSGS